MIRIIKGIEPAKWIEHKNTPDAVFDGIQPLREALLKEQGYICGYCMRRIPILKKPSPNSPETKIEHLIKRVERSDANFMAITMGYNNFIICCDGIIDGDTKNPHCDTKKLEQDLDSRLFPTNANIENIINYSSTGEIKCDDVDLKKEIDKKLNLNNKRLVENRNATLYLVIIELGKTHWTKPQLNSKLTEWTTKGAGGKHREYCGIAIQFLKKRIQRAN